MWIEIAEHRDWIVGLVHKRSRTSDPPLWSALRVVLHILTVMTGTAGRGRRKSCLVTPVRTRTDRRMTCSDGTAEPGIDSLYSRARRVYQYVAHVLTCIHPLNESKVVDLSPVDSSPTSSKHNYQQDLSRRPAVSKMDCKRASNS